MSNTFNLQLFEKEIERLLFSKKRRTDGKEVLKSDEVLHARDKS